MGMPKDVILVAYEKGYRVTEDGLFLNPKGKQLPIKQRSNHKYPQTAINVGNSQRKNLLIHRLAAYCFYGDALFKEGVVVRHMSEDLLNVSIDNIRIGTRSDNERDKSPELRAQVGREANKARKETRRLSMRRFSDEEVREIRSMYKGDKKYQAIANHFGVDNSIIKQIVNNKTYRDVV